MVLAEKNKNPLNLRPLPNGEKWQGQVGVDRNGYSGAFVVFENNVMGVRAAVVNMRSYVKYAGCRTLRDVIYRWAPPTGDHDGDGKADYDNHTREYLQSVCKATGLSEAFSFLPIVEADPPGYFREALDRIILAMNRVEAGKQTITLAEATQGVEKALGVPKGYVRQDDGNIVREDMKQSETIKLNNTGQLANVAGTATTVVTAVAAIPDWRVAAIVAGLVALTGIAVGVYLWRLRKDRQKMHEEGIA